MTSLFGVIRAATKAKAAEDGSRGGFGHEERCPKRDKMAQILIYGLLDIGAEITKHGLAMV